MRRPHALLPLLFVLAFLALGAACSRPAGLFNDQNARAHIGMLADTIGSRPIGTPANARAREYIVDQLRQFGFEVRVQEAESRRASIGRAARVANIVAVRQGSRSEAVGIVCHYDSVAAGPGAADDGLGVAVALEAARVLAARANPTWTVMVLVTDGEEWGLMGAAALTTDRDVMRRLNAYINLDSIGAAGPPMLFEAGPGNGWLLSAWRRAAPYPRGGSFAGEIYRRLPNDTDFSILKLQDIPGLNFAAVADSYRYHTSRDTPERLPQATLRQMGEQVVTLVTALDGVDITQRSSADRTYFDVAGRSAVAYGPYVGLWIAFAALSLGVVAWVKVIAAAVRMEGILRWLLMCFWILFGTAAIVASMIGTTWALRAAREVFHPWYARPGRFFLLLLAVAISVGWGVARIGRWLPPRAHGVRHPVVVWSVTLPAWIAAAAAAMWFVPGAAYLWMLPLFAAGLLLAAVPARHAGFVRVASLGVLAVAASLWVQNTAELLRFAVTALGRFPIITPVFAYAAVLAAAGLVVVPPMIAAFAPANPVLRPSLATAMSLLAIAVGAGFSYAAPAYTDDAPLRRHARALQDGDGAAVWEVASIEPGLDLGDGAPTGWTRVRDAPPVSVPAGTLPHPFVFRATGASLGPAPIAIAALSAEPVAAGTELSVTVVPRRPGLAITFILPAGLEPARSSLPGLQRRDRWTAIYVAPPAEGIVFRASFGKIAPPALRDLRIAATVQGGRDWPPPPWLPPQRTAWTVDATWIVAPFALPIAPVPPLR
jgi:hypothetical protein